MLADGATGTKSFAMGLASGGAPEIWNLEHPDRVRALHQAFVDADSDIREQLRGPRGLIVARRRDELDVFRSERARDAAGLAEHGGRMRHRNSGVDSQTVRYSP